MYEDTTNVIESIKQYFDNKLGKVFEFEIVGGGSTITYLSDGYQFEVLPGFIQALHPNDFNIPIQDRLESVIDLAKLKPPIALCFGSRVENQKLVYFCDDADFDFGQSPAISG